MKIKHNEDGSVTVTIPKGDELYDPTEGGLYVAETVSKADFDRLAAGKDPIAADVADEEAKLDETTKAELDRRAAEAAAQQLARDRAQSQERNDQRIASEKAALSAAATARAARDRQDSAIAGTPLTEGQEAAASATVHEAAEATGTGSKEDPQKQPDHKPASATAPKPKRVRPSRAKAQPKG